MKVLYVVFITILALTVLAVIVPLSIILLLAHGLPVFYTQIRIGLGGKPFTLYKFRTMKSGSEKQQSRYNTLNEADGPVFKIHNDPRFTAFGRFLSHTGLDELPQILNIIKGDMNIVGPRPLPLREASKIPLIYRKRHDQKPGIVSPWILEGYHARSFAEWMKSDIRYVSNKNCRTDIAIIGRCFVVFAKLIVRELVMGPNTQK